MALLNPESITYFSIISSLAAGYSNTVGILYLIQSQSQLTAFASAPDGNYITLLAQKFLTMYAARDFMPLAT